MLSKAESSWFENWGWLVKLVLLFACAFSGVPILMAIPLLWIILDH